MRVLLGAALITCLVINATAVCCKRKEGFGCCGSGAGTCNVFCCNYGSCDNQCENSGAQDRLTFFNSIQGGKDIDMPTFTQYVKDARKLPASGVDPSKPRTISIPDAFKM